MMRKMMIIIAILGGGIAQAQTNDWSWTFQRWGSTCGLLFEDTGLAVSVKVAIRNDIAHSYTFALTDNLYTRIYTSDDDEYGTFVGYDGLQGNNGYAEDLDGWKYKLHNGNRYFHVEKDLSDKYLTQIALTNQHKTAVGSLANFLQAFNNAVTNNANPPESLQMWWSLEQEIPLSLTYQQTGSSEVYIATGEKAVRFWNQFSDISLFVPSILNLRHGGEAEGLWCETGFRKRSNGEYRRGFELVYRGGSWRMALPEF